MKRTQLNTSRLVVGLLLVMTALAFELLIIAILIAKKWFPYLAPLMAAHPDLRAYELPMIGGLYTLARPFIDGGMAAAIPDPAVRDRTLTVYTDVRRVMAALQIPSTATITLLLVDRSGRIFWRDAGAYDAERAAGLERALAPLSG